MLNDEQFCISTVYIIRMSFSASKYFTIDMTLLWFSRVCDCVCVCVCVCECVRACVRACVCLGGEGSERIWSKCEKGKGKEVERHLSASVMNSPSSFMHG